MKKRLNKIYLLILVGAFLTLIVSGSVAAQEGDECEDKKEAQKWEQKSEKGGSDKAFTKAAEKNKPWKTKVMPGIKVKIPPVPIPAPPRPFHGDFAEKSIEVSEKVNVSFCITRGKVKINGWKRNEVRIFVDGAKEVGFQVVEKSESGEKPVWVMVLGYDPEKSKNYRRSECLSGRVIEIDVPFGAAIDAKGGVGGVSIESVSRVKLKKIGGDVLLKNIKNGINATNFEGNIIVNQSGGTMLLETTTGNIVTLGAKPSDFGDTFRAKTNSGAVVLEKVEYRQGEIYSTSGSVKFVGGVLFNSQFEFITTKGSITLQVPKDLSADIIATYGGSFRSNIPIKNISKSGDSKIRSLSGTFGKGGAKLIFRTYDGGILIESL